MDTVSSLPSDRRLTLADNTRQKRRKGDKSAQWTRAFTHSLRYFFRSIFICSFYWFLQALYAVLPAVIDSNPFSSDGTPASTKPTPTLDMLLSILRTTLSALNHYVVHIHICSQLFCYLFFFISTSLVNMLMDKGRCSDKLWYHKEKMIHPGLGLVSTGGGVFYNKILLYQSYIVYTRITINHTNVHGKHREKSLH